MCSNFKKILNQYVILFLTMIPLFSYTFVYHVFEEVMQLSSYALDSYAERTLREVGLPADYILYFFRDLYEKNYFFISLEERDIKIPKIIHQIWIGKEIPEELKMFSQSWKIFHPNWEYRLWTQNDIKDFCFENIEYILNSRNPAEISDIMRYEILYRYGGLYVDMDQECLRSFDKLHESYDFYIGIQPLDSGIVQLGTGVIGATSGHPILKALIKAIAKNWKQFKDKQAITQRTGPILCTKIFLKYAYDSECRNIALPALYFYPLGSQEYEINKNKWITDGAFAVHYWAKTWLLPQFRRNQFKSIKNY